MLVDYIEANNGHFLHHNPCPHHVTQLPQSSIIIIKLSPLPSPPTTSALYAEYAVVWYFGGNSRSQ